jgi:hypothetical protein
MLTRYERNRQARQADNERRLCGESLEAFHARETAKPPTLPQVYAANKIGRVRCNRTLSLFHATHSDDDARLWDKPDTTVSLFDVSPGGGK